MCLLLQLMEEQTEEKDDKDKDYDVTDEGWFQFPVGYPNGDAKHDHFR